MQALRLVSFDLARSNPVGGPAYAQIRRAKAWWDAKLASSFRARPTFPDAGALSELKRDGVPRQSRRARPARALRIAIAAVALNFGAGLGLAGWGALQALGLVAEPAVESVQREQAALITQLDSNFHDLNAAVAGLSARVYSAEDREDATAARIAEIDAALDVLRASMNEMRAAQHAAAEAWREPVAEIAAAATKARGDIVRLRASVDELSRLRQPEVVTIGTRIDRIEQAMVQHKLFGPMRGSIEEPKARRQPLAVPERSAADGHIINLTPAP